MLSKFDAGVRSVSAALPYSFEDVEDPSSDGENDEVQSACFGLGHKEAREACGVRRLPLCLTTIAGIGALVLVFVFPFAYVFKHAEASIPQPQWIVRGLVIDDINAPLSTGNLPQSLININLTVVAEVSNPSPIPARADPGVFAIRCHDVVIGSAVFQSVALPPNGRANLTAHAVVDRVPGDVGVLMLQDILAPPYQLTIAVEGTVTARVGTLLQVQCATSCNISTSISANPRKQISYADKICVCKYVM